MTLKNDLQKLDLHDRQAVERIDMDDLIDRILDHIGSTDPELRDALILFNDRANGIHYRGLS
ncbi:hypothetical protein [Lentibacillus salicampi]|uniref:Uncharacterized protein n=1 Tax=Lentibacillus salicampi TaxID=175306 RepID=A0A4Y9A8V8_9BACI|nr:hypothetical protein [Lentibacillus salicampi]TFJ91300.1 hypothetical protein E4U82_18405 [Lentibacillus salicampi]